MIERVKYATAAVTLIAGLVVPEFATAGCGSCGPAAGAAAVKPAPTCAKSTCGKAKACASKCGKKAKGCPAGCTKPCCAPKEASEAAVIDTHTLQALLAAGTKVTVLDARSGKWDDGRRVPGATALAAGSTAEQAAAVIPSKDSLVVTYCSNLQCPASGMLAANLKTLGYKNILEYSAGIEGWAKHGNPVEQAK
jgi:rhodanese-related sulfurtransferase